MKQPTLISEEKTMFNQQSPLETLASYAISFVAGAVSLAAVSLYGQWMKRCGTHQANLAKEA
ncbi:hypothetical protein [Janthinobacterium sp. 78]|uniref:hypothetical protein n=1 Tax=Janthinobacterium sp. 78 TaxID=2135631 RepID=UPI000E31A63B|nr:hypothetical protein [Janthinobacterium sp. 78]